MNAIKPQRSPVYRQLEAYEETWKKDHEAIKECWAVEDAAAVGVATAFLIENVVRAWHDRVFRGAEEYSETANDDYRDLFESWAQITKTALNRLAELAQLYGEVEGSSELQQADLRIREQLANWKAPRLSASVGLRDMTLSPAASVELDRVLGMPDPLPSGSSHPRMTELPLHEMRRRPKTV